MALSGEAPLPLFDYPQARLTNIDHKMRRHLRTLARLGAILSLCTMHFLRCTGFLVGGGWVAMLGACQKTETPASASTARVAPAALNAPANSSAGAAATKADARPVPDAVKKVLGRWVRSDGGYSLDLRKADISGVIEAGYYNPKSIHVSRAIWMQGGTGLQVMVELNDVGYPGATYVLNYDPAADRLAGKYNQPQMQQSFDVDFVRQTAPMR